MSEATLRTDSVIDTEQLSQWLQTPSRLRSRAILAAAKTGEARAQTLLGQILLSGEGIEQDSSLAVTWFNIAARQQEPMALNMLGRCYEKGWGVKADDGKAADYYRQAAALDLDWGQYNLANLLATGRGITQNLQQAFALYQQAATQGHAKSMNLVGRCYEEGLGVPIDLPQAIAWYHRSALAGDFRGQYSLATCFLSAGDIGNAVLWLKRALVSGNLNFLRTSRSALGQVALPEIQHIALAYHQRAAELGDYTDRQALEIFHSGHKKPA